MGASEASFALQFISYNFIVAQQCIFTGTKPFSYLTFLQILWRRKRHAIYQRHERRDECDKKEENSWKLGTRPVVRNDGGFIEKCITEQCKKSSRLGLVRGGGV